MNIEPKFLSVDDILRLHRFAIEDQGCNGSLRDAALLESAVATPHVIDTTTRKCEIFI